VINVPELEDRWQVATQLEKLVEVTWPETCQGRNIQLSCFFSLNTTPIYSQ